MALAKSQRSLKAWGDQKWTTKSGKKSSETGEVYLPKAKIERLKKSKEGKKAVKNMGYTEDVDGNTLMKKDYAMMMGGYGKEPLKKHCK